AVNASGVGRGILHTRKLRRRRRATLATTSVTCTAPDPGARFRWSYLLLTLPDAFVRIDALVLVRFPETPYPHDRSTDPDAVVRRVCVGVFPRVRKTVYER